LFEPRCSLCGVKTRRRGGRELVGHLPVGNLTLLFTDIEGSTRLLQRLGDKEYGRLLADHHRLLRRAITEADGLEIKSEGDSFFAVFHEPDQAIGAAAQAQRALAAQEWPQSIGVAVRMGVHTGDVDLAEREYVGLDVHRAARISDAGHGGQVLVSETTAELVGKALPADLRLRDLGVHRLKDLRESERLYQLVIEGLPADFPPPRSQEIAASGLPQQLTSFFGREREIAETRELLADSRLVTLTGAGGTGKSRLALRLATEVLGDFPDGVRYVALAALREPDLVLPEIARAFDVVEGDDLRGRLVETIGSQRVLLILDNFEHLLPAAAEVAGLLADTPRLKILVTSRSRLNVPGEREFIVPPLAVPDLRRLPPLDTLAHLPAIALFIDRAQAVRPDFRLTEGNARAVVDICARVDGLPLAIELAAARVRLMSPDKICDRLSNRLALLASTSAGVAERQRTLRATIQWSYELLGDEERLLFRRLGVFLGGALLPLVAQVVQADDEFALMEQLGSLIDKSLLRLSAKEGWGGALRVEMLESIRDFALERLAENGDIDEYRRRHALVFVDLAEQAEPHLTGTEGGPWLDRLEREHDNMRAAFGWALESGRGDVAVRLTYALWRYWQMRGHLTEGRERAEQALAALGDTVEAELRSRAFAAAGSLAYWQADWPAARAHYEAALEVDRRRDEPAAVAEALYNLSFTYSVPRTDVEHALDLAQEALAIFRRLDDRAGVAKTLWAMGIIANSLPEARPTDAVDYYQEAAAIFEQLDNRPMLAWARFMEADARTPAGTTNEARRLTVDALRIFVELGDVSGYALCLHGLAVLEWADRRRPSAVRLAAAAQAIARSSGVNLTISTSGRWLGRFGFDDHALDADVVERDPELATEWAAGSQLTTEQAVEDATRVAAGT
jgi:predicted ATPase/class 3 adenylate cyclase